MVRIPRIDHIDIQAGEMPHISGSKPRPTCDDDSGYLRIAHIYCLALALSPGGQLGGRLSSRLIEVKDAPFQVFCHEFFEGGFKGLPALSLRQ